MLTREDCRECTTCGELCADDMPCQRCEPELFREWLDMEQDMDRAFETPALLPEIDDLSDYSGIGPDEDCDEDEEDDDEIYCPAEYGEPVGVS